MNNSLILVPWCLCGKYLGSSNLTMNNDKLEVNAHEEQGPQAKVALKNWPKTTHNFSL